MATAEKIGDWEQVRVMGWLRMKRELVQGTQGAEQNTRWETKHWNTVFLIKHERLQTKDRS